MASGRNTRRFCRRTRSSSPRRNSRQRQRSKPWAVLCTDRDFILLPFSATKRMAFCEAGHLDEKIRCFDPRADSAGALGAGGWGHVRGRAPHGGGDHRPEEGGAVRPRQREGCVRHRLHRRPHANAHPLNCRGARAFCSRAAAAAAATTAVSACRPRASLAHQASDPLVHAARRGAARAASSLVLKSAELAHRMRLRQDALEMLSRMEHRGACGCEIDTGDGAGAIFTLPHYPLMFMRGGPTRPSRPRR